MKKLFIVILILVAIAIFAYYTGVYTYFITKKVVEEMPENSAQQIVIKEGQFIDADFFHKGKGTAKIISFANDRKILRFENFDITNGPDLFVYLSDSENPSRNLESLGNFIDLGMLKGNKGNQNYDLPVNIDLEKYKSIVIWCKQFGVLFPYAVFQ